MWLLLLLLLAFLIGPLLQIGFALLGRTLSPGETQGGLSSAVWPAQGEVVGTLTPTLRWPDTGANRYEVELQRESDEGDLLWSYTLLTVANRLTVPDGLLETNDAYLWLVSALDEQTDTREPLFTGRFSTSTRLIAGDLVVSPAAYLVNPDSLLNGARIHVSVPDGVRVDMRLPEVLTAARTGRIAMGGSFEVTLRPSLAFAAVRPADLEQDGVLGHIELRAGTDMLRIPVRVDVSAMGPLLRTLHTGFDPLLDTPAFGNFADGLLARFTRGTCLGMVLAADSAYANCRDCHEGQRCTCVRMRLRSLLLPETVKNEMNFLHLANLHPQNWSVAVSSLVTADGQYNIAGEVLAQLRQSDPVPMAVIPRRGRLLGEPKGNMGHAVLAYAIHEFDDYYLVHLYDPDEIYLTGGALASFLLIGRTGEHQGRVMLAGSRGYEDVEAFSIPRAHVLSTLTPSISQTFSALDASLAEAFSGE